ncbi:hypothetical protein O181_006809 [Austropuccinia psidii MF-1]|uniref:Uncharacterized protein n=1 Tax=Austropuccinia psidii MF-1 TaxID=1389203 RepID=A0A9Q3GH90_9BASI|nr:hypothetical protein [Austropuccinia psidii MF-1]
MPAPPSRCDSNTAPPSPPSSLLTLPHPCRLQSLCSRGALKIYLLHHPQPSLCLILSAVYHAYACVVPSQHASDAAPPSLPAPLPLTIPMLLLPHQDVPWTLPSTLLAPSPTRQLPSLCSCSVLLTCLRCCSHTSIILNATYHPYAPAILSR